jgi:hypothetical protein
MCAQLEGALREQVERLVALRPGIVLVERSVGRAAQDALLQAGISLALNCKRAVLDMLARCTGAEARALPCCWLLSQHPSGLPSRGTVTGVPPRRHAQRQAKHEPCRAWQRKRHQKAER